MALKTMAVVVDDDFNHKKVFASIRIISIAGKFRKCRKKNCRPSD